MLFNSIDFLIFLPIVFFLYWFVANKNLKYQNLLLLASSYYFYSCWDWRFLFLLIFSTQLDYYTGIKIFNSTRRTNKKIWLWISVGVNLGFLGVFKYYNFFAESFEQAMSLLGIKTSLGSLKVILPVGISFYTFHGLSYVIDIYYDRIKPERNFINYSLFVSFFPLLVAGPIERATHLLPQIVKKRDFNYRNAVDGLRQILWGLFKKIVIANNCAEFADTIFNNNSHQSGSTIILGALFFTYQIYCDFSGYSDIALGTAKLFGIDLLRNFSYPYFSRDIAEFWRRWHISLSSWFKDYLYIPLGGSKGGMWLKIRNTFIIFIVSGFWHGANWTFIIWGLLNAIYIMPSIIFNTNRNNIEIVAKGNFFPNFREIISIGITFTVTVFAWIFFRASNVTNAFLYIKEIFSYSILSLPKFEGMKNSYVILLLTFIMFFIEWFGREYQYGLAFVSKFKHRKMRWFMYYLLIFIIIYYSGKEQQFIYFQF
ncbi:MBOAT family O-acyltransferase [Flavobacterium aciduliphilum]|uniref:D-alanyl-lipoteichoic acid acyltransferase DltB (MBOAT superfamily) n=1 Tax=Flavobacterium aciduliphilum TaxID=1101402 RepID=A0A328Y649_9FLAO|nr:MBOAT family O-acyltransferase [Flavobacterium aciduliphilum]RAR69301.1 D-alanyl-lipoteichoic acid acyltransferase DltB (MBOAT superfamily) [Flavobacterium aciduliphilum]